MRVLAIVALFIAIASAQSGIAIIKGTQFDSGITGYITFITNAANSSLVEVSVNVSGITNGPNSTHGIHVHMWGDISDPTGAAAGGHFALPGETHNCPPNDTRHTGDMGNWDAVEGSIIQTKIFDKLSLTGANSIIARGVIIHNLTDDCTTQPTGASGGRLAQGVIGVMNVTGNTASNGSPRTVSGTDNVMCFLSPISGYAESITGYGLISQQSSGGVYVLVQLAGVANGTIHSAHIHQYGDLRSAAAVGGHWNPTVQRHGMYGYPQHHAGDLGNVIYFQDANNTMPAANFTQWVNNSFNVIGGLYNVAGLAMVIHQQRDNCSDPIGNAGARYSTCVWGLVNTTLSVFNPVRPTGVSTNYDAITIANCNASFNITTTTTTTSSATSTSATSASATTTGSAVTSTTSSASFMVFSALTILAALLF